MPPTRKAPPSPQRPTMTDVAKAAGVSQSTVSMVLNNATGARLSAETRARVLGQAIALGYQLPRRAVVPGFGMALPLIGGSPGGAAWAGTVGSAFGGAFGGADAQGTGAAGVHTGTTAGPGTPVRPVIGYLVDEISTSPHPVVSIDGARDAAWEQGCLLHVAITGNHAGQEAEAIAALRAHPGLLGLIYSTIFTREVTPPAFLAGLPTVLLNCHDSARKLPAVVPGEVAGGHAATEFLIRHGHSRIGFINGEPWMEAAQDRLKGYRRALATADLPFDAQLVREGDWMASTGHDHTLALMALTQPPSAIFCANDLMALGALEALRHLGLRVPQDVSVMGYDDQEISRHTHPPLSTLVLPNYEMGRTAVETLLAMAEPGAIASSQGGSLSGSPSGTPRPWRALTKIAGPVVERESVAPPRRMA